MLYCTCKYRPFNGELLTILIKYRFIQISSIVQQGSVHVNVSVFCNGLNEQCDMWWVKCQRVVKKCDKYWFVTLGTELYVPAGVERNVYRACPQLFWVDLLFRKLHNFVFICELLESKFLSNKLLTINWSTCTCTCKCITNVHSMISQWHIV